MDEKKKMGQVKGAKASYEPPETKKYDPLEIVRGTGGGGECSLYYVSLYTECSLYYYY
jgi:hypothetical protein